MRSIHLPKNFADWRTTARTLLQEEVHPLQVHWMDPHETLLDLDFSASTPPSQTIENRTYRIPKAFLNLASTVACYRSNTKWSTLYHVLWKLTHENKKLLEVGLDQHLLQCTEMRKAIHRDCHKMKAFVRFKERRFPDRSNAPYYLAWFEPMHLITERMASFFQKRFTNMNWSILTPDVCLHWHDKHLQTSPGLTEKPDLSDDPFESLWLTYYKNIYNPARLKEKAMTNEMPKKYWKNLPEAKLIEKLSQKGRKMDLRREWDSP